MKRTVIFGICIALAACGPSQKDIENVATITCNIMGESRNMDAAFRIKEINSAREKIGAEPYLGTDWQIKESFSRGICKELVKGDGAYEVALLRIKAAKGATLYEDCTACHGPNGLGGIGAQLSGSSSKYIAAKLKDLRVGKTISDMSHYCTDTVQSLSDADITNVTAYIATFE